MYDLIQNCQNRLFAPSTQWTIACEAAAGGIASYALEIVHPVGGILFGASHALSSVLLTTLLDNLPVDTRSPSFKVAKFASSFLIGIGIAHVLTATLGFPLTFGTALVLTLVMLITSFVIEFMRTGRVSCLHALIDVMNGRSSSPIGVRITIN